VKENFPCPRNEGVQRGGRIVPLVLNLGTEGMQRSPSRPCPFVSRKDPWYPVNRRVGGPQSPVWRLWSREIFFYPYSVSS